MVENAIKVTDVLLNNAFYELFLEIKRIDLELHEG